MNAGDAVFAIYVALAVAIMVVAIRENRRVKREDRELILSAAAELRRELGRIARANERLAVSARASHQRDAGESVGSEIETAFDSLDERRWAQLTEAAKKRGVPNEEIALEALDAYLTQSMPTTRGRGTG